jgi:metal-sulfur cluster biosynthetic enzyme
MPKEVARDDVVQAVNKVEHPEIAATLFELGMVRDVDYSPEMKEASLTLVLPLMGIPALVRDYMANALAKAVEELGAELNISFAEMTDAEKAAFFAKEHAQWRG